MIVKAFLLAFIIAFLSQNSLAKDEDTSPVTKLKAVYVTIRAGPTEKPKTEWKLETEVEPTFMDTVKLSETGRQNMYDLGNVIGTYYKEERIITLIPRGCSAVRCKASAALFRKGFVNERNFDNKIEVSNEEMERTYDAELANQRGRFFQNCPKFDKESKKSMLKVWTEEKKKMFKKTIDVIKTNIEVQTTHPFFIWTIWESIHTMSKEIPKWMDEEVKEDLISISRLYFKAMLSSGWARSLSAGTLVNEILSDASNFNEDEVQIKVYAGEVTELEAVVATFSGPQGYQKIPKIDGKIRNLYYLPHGSAMLIEIHELLTDERDGNKKYGLKILFRIGKSDTLVAVQIKGCDQEICPLETVKSLLGGYALEAEKLEESCSK